MSKRILADLHKAGPYSINTQDIEALTAQATALDYPLIRVAPEKAPSTKAWLQDLGTALGFPAHFGANFDALHDYLCDQEIMPQRNCVLLFQHLDRLTGDDCTTLIAVTRSASKEWHSEGRRLWVLFAANDLALAPLPLN